MDLQNGYKVIYDKATGTTRAFYASRTGAFADADKIAEFAMGTYKLIYEKNGQLYGSNTGIPADGDYCFEEFDKVFKEEPEDNAGTDTGNNAEAGTGTDAGNDAGTGTGTDTGTDAGTGTGTDAGNDAGTQIEPPTGSPFEEEDEL